MIDLEKLERLHAEATPGPWTQRGNFIFCAQNKRLAYVEAERALDLQTAAYIVAACNSLPALIAELKAARAENGELKRHSEWLERKLQIRIDNNAELIKRIEELEKQKEWMVRQLEGYSCFYTAEDFMERAKKEANA